jgi:hypothetical protein
MNNFKKFGIEEQYIILLAYDPKVGINPKAIEFKSETKATVLFIEDTRTEKLYILSIRPHIIKKIYSDYPQLMKGKKIFYHDSDILFVRLPDFEKMIQSDVSYLSDTISYIGANYIKHKGGNDLLQQMCNIVGIDPALVEHNQNISGGAQYLFNRELTSGFWNKVEYDCNELYKLMISTSNKYSPEHPIQSWTSDMWSLLWNLWFTGITTSISSELSFSWATSPISHLHRHSIYHNAGATVDNKNLFFKGKFINKSPFDEDLSYVSTDFCSAYYVDEINSTAKSRVYL